MLLAIDIGNTNITVGVFPLSQEQDSKIRNPSDRENLLDVKPHSPLATWRISSDAKRTSDEYGTQILDFLHYSLINKEDISAVAVASVVPALDETINLASKTYLKKRPLFFNHNHFVTHAGLIINVDNPAEVGVDRLLNALSAHELFKDRPAIVVDFGTAVTFDCVGAKGDYLGGAILPGPAASADALARHTAKLPRVTIARPNHLIGKSTIECIQSGLWHGYIFTVKNFIAALRKELGKKSVAIATGGMSGIFEKSDIKEIDIFSPTLTIEGIKILWELIRGESKKQDTKIKKVEVKDKTSRRISAV